MEKSTSIILSIAPYRETSGILRLFTSARGLIHGIAKGIRKSGKSSTPVDRGFLLEAQLYYRPNRELHTLGSLNVLNFFPGIRSDIAKTAIRDIALELYLKSIKQSDAHPELFDLIVAFFTDMENPSLSAKASFPLLWQFISRYCVMMGYGAIDGLIDKSTDNGDMRTTESILSYCTRHLDIRGQFNSFEFLRTV